MRHSTRLFLLLGWLGVVLLALTASGDVAAQPGKGGKKGFGGGGPAETLDSFVDRIMAFNKAKDGKLTKEELTDARLHALFDRADANKDGVVTRDELKVLYEKETAAFGKGGFDKGDFGGFGKGGKGDFGKGDFGDKKGPKGFGKGPPPFGQILPGFIQEYLELSDTQRKQVADLQKEVETRLDKILSADQRQQLRELREMRDKGPGGFGPPDKKGPPPKDR